MKSGRLCAEPSRKDTPTLLHLARDVSHRNRASHQATRQAHTNPHLQAREGVSASQSLSKESSGKSTHSPKSAIVLTLTLTLALALAHTHPRARAHAPLPSPSPSPLTDHRSPSPRPDHPHPDPSITSFRTALNASAAGKLKSGVRPPHSSGVAWIRVLR